MKTYKLTTLTATGTVVSVALSGAGHHWTVTLASLTDPDLNVVYRFHTQELADQCYRIEKERLQKIGLKPEREINEP